MNSRDFHLLASLGIVGAEWWDKMSPEEQKKYLEDHPGSKQKVTKQEPGKEEREKGEPSAPGAPAPGKQEKARAAFDKLNKTVRDKLDAEGISTKKSDIMPAWMSLEGNKVQVNGWAALGRSKYALEDADGVAADIKRQHAFGTAIADFKKMIPDVGPKDPSFARNVALNVAGHIYKTHDKNPESIVKALDKSQKGVFGPSDWDQLDPDKKLEIASQLSEASDSMDIFSSPAAKEYPEFDAERESQWTDNERDMFDYLKGHDVVKQLPENTIKYMVDDLGSSSFEGVEPGDLIRTYLEEAGVNKRMPKRKFETMLKDLGETWLGSR